MKWNNISVEDAKAHAREKLKCIAAINRKVLAKVDAEQTEVAINAPNVPVWLPEIKLNNK